MEREKEMMEAPKEEKKYPCKFCEKSFPSFRGLGGHMKIHPGDKMKTKSTYGNEEPEDLVLTPKSKMKDVALVLMDMQNKPYYSKNEELVDLTPESKVNDVAHVEIDRNEMLENGIPESKVEEAARKSLSQEMWHKDREKIQGTAAPEEKEQIEQAAKPGSETDVSLTDSTTVYECNTCHGYFGSQQELGDHLAGQTSDGTCPQDIESTAVVARFNCDGYILRSNVGWATRRRS